jgi:hypothetical protein
VRWGGGGGCCEQCSGSVGFFYGSVSLDQYPIKTDLDLDPTHPMVK